MMEVTVVEGRWSWPLIVVVGCGHSWLPWWWSLELCQSWPPTKVVEVIYIYIDCDEGKMHYWWTWYKISAAYQIALLDVELNLYLTSSPKYSLPYIFYICTYFPHISQLVKINIIYELKIKIDFLPKFFRNRKFLLPSRLFIYLFLSLVRFGIDIALMTS